MAGLVLGVEVQADLGGIDAVSARNAQVHDAAVEAGLAEFGAHHCQVDVRRHLFAQLQRLVQHLLLLVGAGLLVRK